MGLSGRKVKQRISADPRNLGWADDAARFGSNYLSKFGWDASKGLGAGGDGMKSHIKVFHKLDMLGIGAAQSKDPNGIAWKQNRDFENLLQRLNENLQVEQTPNSDKTEESNAENDSDEGERKQKKRKHKETKNEEGSDRKKKKRNREHGKKRETLDGEELVSMQAETPVEAKSIVEVQKVVAFPPHRAHRARLIAAKNIASKSAAHISEILGIAPTSQPVQNTAAAPGKLTSVTDTDALGMDKITTSAKSLADYFKEKLDARMGSSSGAPTPTVARVDIDDAHEAPRRGIGASRMHLEIQSETRVEEETQKIGLLKFSSLLSSSFLAATSSSASFIISQNEKEEENEGVARLSDVDFNTETKKSKKEKGKDGKKSKDGLVDEEEKAEKPKERENKKDKKGKGKATEGIEGDIDASDKRKKRQKEKKAKKKKAAEEALKAQILEDIVRKSSHKKDKKHKHQKCDASAEPQDCSYNLNGKQTDSG
ncbi:hypothetical protein BDN70DRAFT_995724 [Pholiota conissans]|uniref:G-patch domain-containing protein n=1 Tax=Pholiota conissans TaxID=109636 RepID=A0A9P5YXH2_9AGAR|nr:hypothetical protein BDN70DRAFT_995724 [Pholiota conissans]